MIKYEFKKINIFKFFERVKDEESALNLLMLYGVISYLKKCPRYLKVMKIKDKKSRNIKHFYYYCNFSDKLKTVKSFTVFNNIKIPMYKVLRCFYAFSMSWTNKMITDHIDLNKNSETKLFVLFKKISTTKGLENNNVLIGGQGLIIEIDETHLFKGK